jgi:hypothetical protein
LFGAESGVDGRSKGPERGLQGRFGKGETPLATKNMQLSGYKWVTDFFIWKICAVCAKVVCGSFVKMAYYRDGAEFGTH